MRIRNATDPVYTPNSMGGPEVDPKRAAEVHWASDGDMVRTAYALRQDDDDWGQPGTLVREVLDDDARDRLAHNIIGHVSDGVREPVLSRVFEYWKNRRPRSRQEGRGGRPRQHQRRQLLVAPIGRPGALSPFERPGRLAVDGDWHDHAHEHRCRLHHRINRNRRRPRRPREVHRRQNRSGNPTAEGDGRQRRGRQPRTALLRRLRRVFLGALRLVRASRRSISTTRPASPSRSASARTSRAGSASTQT